jgi:hypothetical protein
MAGFGVNRTGFDSGFVHKQQWNGSRFPTHAVKCRPSRFYRSRCFLILRVVAKFLESRGPPDDEQPVPIFYPLWYATASQ